MDPIVPTHEARQDTSYSLETALYISFFFLFSSEQETHLCQKQADDGAYNNEGNAFRCLGVVRFHVVGNVVQRQRRNQLHRRCNQSRWRLRVQGETFKERDLKTSFTCGETLFVAYILGPLWMQDESWRIHDQSNIFGYLVDQWEYSAKPHQNKPRLRHTWSLFACYGMSCCTCVVSTWFIQSICVYRGKARIGETQGSTFQGVIFLANMCVYTCMCWNAESNCWRGFVSVC